MRLTICTLLIAGLPVLTTAQEVPAPQSLLEDFLATNSENIDGCFGDVIGLEGAAACRIPGDCRSGAGTSGRAA